MKVGHFIPAYRQTVHVEVAMALARDAAWCHSKKLTHVAFWREGTGIARLRNQAVGDAYRHGCDLLLMQDSDVFATPPETFSGLETLFETMDETDAAVVGAACMIRNARADGPQVNCEPAHPGEIYEGVVGTGLMLIDMRKLCDLPRPWFVHRDREDGLQVECSEDIYFCRHVAAAGHKVIVDYNVRVGHAGSTVSATQIPR